MADGVKVTLVFGNLAEANGLRKGLAVLRQEFLNGSLLSNDPADSAADAAMEAGVWEGLTQLNRQLPRDQTLGVFGRIGLVDGDCGKVPADQ